jgi:microcystin-dependent protein
MASTPILGSIHLFTGNFAPRGFALCAGQLLAISSNAALFSILGTTYGGDGVRTFALPNLQCRAAIQQGAGPDLGDVALGAQGGAESVTLTENNLPIHNHTAVVTVNAANDPRNQGSSPAGAVLNTTNAPKIYTSTPPTVTMNPGAATAVLAPSGGSLPVSTLSPYLGLNFIIATTGIFPSRN